MNSIFDTEKTSEMFIAEEVGQQVVNLVTDKSRESFK